MSDYIKNKIKDLEWEHPQHLEFRTDCSECYKEKKEKIIKAERNGLFYSGDNDEGQAEFIGTEKQWRAYDNDLGSITEEEYNKLNSKIIVVDESPSVINKSPSVKDEYDYDKDDEIYHEENS